MHVLTIDASAMCSLASSLGGSLADGAALPTRGDSGDYNDSEIMLEVVVQVDTGAGGAQQRTCIFSDS
jgi:hypothetical protein